MTTDKDAQSNPRILVIDDDADVRHVLAFALTYQGYVVLEAATGTEGITLAVTAQPAVALVDLSLDDMSGVAVLERIRRDCPWTERFVISGNPIAASQVANHDPGIFGVLCKPFDMSQLSAAIAAAAARAARSLRMVEQPSRPPAEAPQSTVDANVLLADLQTLRIIEAGSAIAVLTHHTLADLTGFRVDRLFPSLDWPAMQAPTSALPVICQSVMLTEEGEPIPVTLTLTAAPGLAGPRLKILVDSAHGALETNFAHEQAR